MISENESKVGLSRIAAKTEIKQLLPTPLSPKMEIFTLEMVSSRAPDMVNVLRILIRGKIIIFGHYYRLIKKLSQIF